VLWLWSILSIGVLNYVDWLFPDSGLKQWQSVGLPGPRFEVRSALEVALLAGIVRTLYWCLGNTVSRGRIRVGAVAGGGILLLLFGMSAKGGVTRAFIVLFGSDLSQVGVALKLFDWGTLVWLGIATPLAMAMDLLPRETNEFFFRRVSAATVGVATLLSLVPSVVALAFNALGSNTALIDSLPAAWWMRKTIVLFFSAGLSEELVWRVLACLACLRLFEANGQRAAILWSISWTTFLFFVAHVGSSLGTLVVAAVIGFINGFIFLKLRSFDACAIGHTVTNTLASRWNVL
jgi:hypothetical protein